MGIDREEAIKIRLEGNKTYNDARERAQALRDDLVVAFPELDPFHGHPKGKFIRIGVDRDERPDGSIIGIDFTIKIDFYRTTLQDLLKIAAVVAKHFPEYKEGCA
jgi:hypothetical protein